MITLHITEVLAYFLKEHTIYTENCCKNVLSDFGKNPWVTEGIYPLFHKAENFFDIFKCYVRTTKVLVPSQCRKICAGNCNGKCEKNPD